LARFGDYRTT